MSTQIPLRSAKRQRLADKASADVADQLAAQGQLGPKAASIVVQFQSGQDGSALGPSINLPADTGRKQLEMIVNRLRRDLRAAKLGGRRKGDDGDEEADEEDMPYAFHVALPAEQGKDGVAPTAAAARLPVTNSLLDDVLNASAAQKLGLSTEDVLTVVFEPQAVFRVRPVTRISSTLSGHSSPILCSVFSPTGSLLLTGSGDHTARLWDLDSEMPLHSLQGHRNWVLCAEWEGRERKIATGDMNGEVWIWDALDARGGKTGKKAWGTKSSKRVEEQRLAQEELQVNANGDGAASATADTEKKTELQPKKLSVAEKRALRLAAPQGHVLKGHTKWVTALAWEPIHLNASTPRLASSSKDGTVRVWDVSTRTCAYVLGGHTASVNAVRWGGEGLLYTASSDRTVKVWDAKVGKLVRSLDAHAHWVNTLSLSTDWVLRTGPFDHLGRLFDRATANKPKGAAGAEEATQLAALSDKQLDVRTQKAAAQKYNDAVAGGRAELCISGSDDHTLFLWPPQGQTPAAAGDRGASPKKPVARLTGHQKVVNHVSFSPDGRLIASASFDSSIKVWDARSGSSVGTGSGAGAGGKFICNLRAHVGPVYRLAWSSDSRMLVSASKDSTLKLWDMRSFKLKVDLPGHEDEVYCVDFVADKVASGGRDRVVKIWTH